MRVFGYDLTVTKQIPAGARRTRDLVAEADQISGKADPLLAESGSPARGARPSPGPIPPGDEHPGEDLRHHPLRWNFPYAFNQLWTPRRTALTPFSILRQFAEVSDIIRICIETRKDQLTSLGWDIVSRDKRQSNEARPRIDRAKTFFRRPDRRRNFSTWLRAAIEDVLVVDALSIYHRPTRGGGRVADELPIAALELIDGATIQPLLDESGDYPLPPRVAFRQIINGQPVEGGDCTLQQLYYRPRTVRNHTPYGLSPTEAVLLAINAALNREVFNLAYYTEGNVPEGLLEAPEGFTTKQLVEFQEYLDDYLSGNLNARRRLKAVHTGGSKVFQFKEPDFATVYDEWLLKLICAAFAVPPQEIGFTADVNKATGQMQENVVYRRGVKPLSLFFKDLFDEVLADVAMPELEWVWTGGEPEDKKMQAEVDRIYVGMGKTSVDELRARDGQEPIGLGPYVDTAMGPVFVEELLAGAEPDEDVDTTEGGRTPAGQQLPKDGGEAPTVKRADLEAAADLSEAVRTDLRRWKAIILKAMKAGKPVREFYSEEIPFDLYARVRRFVQVAAPSGDIRRIVAAFDLAVADHVAKQGEARTYTKHEKRASRAYQRLMRAHFKAQGTALLEHLRQGLTP